MLRIARSLAGVLPLAVVVSCGDGSATRASVANASARVALAAAALSGQEAPIASEVARPSYMGFDTGEYPGDDAMRAWRTGDSPYHWSGYYLPSPCHQDEGWEGKRETLTAMGYGLAVLYVGQQTWGRRPGAPHMERVKVARKVTSYVGKGKKRHKVTRTVTRTVLRRSPPPPPGATSSPVTLTAPASVAAEQYRTLYYRLERLRSLRPMRVTAFPSCPRRRRSTSARSSGSGRTASGTAMIDGSGSPPAPAWSPTKSSTEWPASWR